MPTRAFTAAAPSDLSIAAPRVANSWLILPLFSGLATKTPLFVVSCRLAITTALPSHVASATLVGLLIDSCCHYDLISIYRDGGKKQFRPVKVKGAHNG
jgi:hypothetical protein